MMKTESDELVVLLAKSRQTRARAWEMAGRKAPAAVNSLERESRGGLLRVEASRLVRLLRPDAVAEGDKEGQV
jgi:hypothetical protein